MTNVRRRRRPAASLLTAAAAAAASACGDPWGTGAPPDGTPPTLDYRIVRLSDSTIAVEGEAHDDRGVSALEWRVIAWAGSVGPRDTTHGTVPVATGAVVPFRVALPAQPIYRQVEVTLSARDAAGNGGIGPSLHHAFGPLVTFGAVEPATDTVWRRGLELGATLTDGRLMTSARVYVDSGTAGERVSTVEFRGGPQPGFSGFPVLVGGAGPHTITVVASHAGGPPVSASFARTFLTPDAPYALAELPDLDADARALGISSRGDVAGWVATAAGRRRATVWRGGVLDVLPFSDSVDVIATRVNASGDVLLQFAPLPGSLRSSTSVRVRRADGALLTVGPLKYAEPENMRDVDACCDLAADLTDGRRALAATEVASVTGLRSAVLDVARGVLVDSADGRFTVSNERGQLAGTVVGGYFNVGRYLRTVGFDAAVGPVAPWRRVCDPLAGRWTTTDPIDIDDDANLLVSQCGNLVFLGRSLPSAQLDVVLGPVAGVRMARQGGLVAALDSAGAILLWRPGSRGPLRVRVPGDLRFDALGGVNGRGQIAAHAARTASGRPGAVLLTPVP